MHKMNMSACFTSDTTKQISMKFGIVLHQKLWRIFLYFYYAVKLRLYNVECYNYRIMIWEGCGSVVGLI
jgi:hypothetical protein